MLTTPDGRRHLLLKRGSRSVQICLLGGTVSQRVHLLADAIIRPDRLRASLRAIEEFNCLLREMPGPLGNRADGKHSRLTQILRAIDGRRAGGSYRDIATVLFGAKRVREDWKDGEHLKNHVRRLVHRGEMFVDGGYRRFLRQGF